MICLRVADFRRLHLVCPAHEVKAWVAPCVADSRCLHNFSPIGPSQLGPDLGCPCVADSSWMHKSRP